MKRLQRSIIATGVIALAVAVAGCAQDGAGTSPDTTAAPGAVQTNVVTSEFGFEPASIEIPADTPVELTLDNRRGMVEHDFSIDELDIHILAKAGESVTETITVPAGTYHVHCAVPGHQEAGMEGSLTAG